MFFERVTCIVCVFQCLPSVPHQYTTCLVSGHVCVCMCVWLLDFAVRNECVKRPEGWTFPYFSQWLYSITECSPAFLVHAEETQRLACTPHWDKQQHHTVRASHRQVENLTNVSGRNLIFQGLHKIIQFCLFSVLLFNARILRKLYLLLFRD